MDLAKRLGPRAFGYCQIGTMNIHSMWHGSCSAAVGIEVIPSVGHPCGLRRVPGSCKGLPEESTSSPNSVNDQSKPIVLTTSGYVALAFFLPAFLLSQRNAARSWVKNQPNTPPKDADPIASSICVAIC